MRPSVFLSHSSSDKAFVRRLARDLIKAGVRVWVDEAEILVGDSLLTKISSGINEADYVAVILSPHSVQSRWVQRELDIAMNQEINGRRVKAIEGNRVKPKKYTLQLLIAMLLLFCGKTIEDRI